MVGYILRFSSPCIYMKISYTASVFLWADIVFLFQPAHPDSHSRIPAQMALFLLDHRRRKNSPNFQRVVEAHLVPLSELLSQPLKACALNLVLACFYISFQVCFSVCMTALSLNLIHTLITLSREGEMLHQSTLKSISGCNLTFQRRVHPTFL